MSFAPAFVTDVELSMPLPDLVAPGADGASSRYARARVLVRVHGAPVGMVDCQLLRGRMRSEHLRQAIQQALTEEVATHAAMDGIVLDWTRDPPLAIGTESTCLLLQPAPQQPRSVSLVICTRDRPEELARCLASLRAIADPELEIVVVDNAPSSDRTIRVVAACGDPRVRYACEPRPGLSRARNYGVAACSGEIVAFTDDDVIVDRLWLDALVRGFGRSQRVGCVTGCVPAAELETAAQEAFETKVGWGHRFFPELFDALDADAEPLLPFRAGVVGAGASFAVSRAALTEVGPFDEALGAGTPACGGEDLDFFSRVLLAGLVIAYEPASIAWHFHRRDEKEIRRQLVAYGTGLGAYATKQVIGRRTRREVFRRIPAALSRLAEISGIGRNAVPLPLGLRTAEIYGMMRGPVAYARSRRRRPGPWR